MATRTGVPPTTAADAHDPQARPGRRAPGASRAVLHALRVVPVALRAPAHVVRALPGVALRLPVGVAVALVPFMALAGLTQQFGLWRPATAIVGLSVGVVAAVAVGRRLPPARLPVWAAAALLLVAIAAGVWAATTHGEHIAVRRDAGAYATYGLSLAHFGGVPIDPQLDVFGLAPGDAWVRVSSGANYQVPVVAGGRLVDLSVVPQFLIGTPATLTLGWWTAGWVGLFAVPAVTGALALCGFGALASLVTGPRVAVGATAALAVSQPILLVLRQTYSEPLSLLMLVAAGVVGVLAVQQQGRRAAMRLGLLAGALAGANLFVRIDAIREIVLLIPVLTVLALTRHPAVRGLVVGLAATAVPALLAATPWDSPYVRQVSSSVLGLVAAGLVLSATGIAAVALVPHTGERTRRLVLRMAPWVVPGAVVAVAAFLVSRPLWLVDRRISGLPGAREFLAQLQRGEGIELDPTRTYAENSVTWLTWWVGVPVLVLALAAAVVGLHRGLRAAAQGTVPAWLVPLSVGVASTLLSLYRPAITPDHPWADRRFVTTVLPTALLLAAVAVAWLATRMGPVGSWRRGLVAGVGALVIAVPVAAATLPVATTRTEVGEVAAAETVCRELPDGAAVIAVDHQSRVEWTPVLRAVCGVPIIGLGQPDGASADQFEAVIATAADRARRNGYTPVVLAGDSSMVVRLRLPWTQVVDLTTTEPQRLILQRPDGARPLSIALWLAGV